MHILVSVFVATVLIFLFFSIGWIVWAVSLPASNVFDEMLNCERRYLSFPVDLPDSFTEIPGVSVGRKAFPDHYYEVIYEDHDVLNTLADAYSLGEARAMVVVCEAARSVTVVFCCLVPESCNDENACVIARSIWEYREDTKRFDGKGCSYFRADGENGRIKDVLSRFMRSDGSIGGGFELIDSALYEELEISEDVESLACDFVFQILVTDFLAAPSSVFLPYSSDCLGDLTVGF